MNEITKYAHDRKIKLTEVAKAYKRPYATIKVWSKTQPKLLKGLIDALVIDRDKGEKDEKTD